jgi:putative ABC transport system ATP-binding protein
MRFPNQELPQGSQEWSKLSAKETLIQALRGVDLDVLRGELLLLVGPSGCGKTTLLSVLAGILDATRGSIEVFGERLDRMNQSQKTAFRRQKIGYIFQQFQLIPTLTAAENAAVPLLISGTPYDQALAKARHSLAEVGLADRSEFYPAALSGGQQQRVAIARALISDPELIVCDEPTASLDSESGRAVMNMLRMTALKDGRAIVVVTHDSRVFPFGDRMAKMLDGRITSILNDPSLFNYEGGHNEETLDDLGGRGRIPVLGVLGVDFDGSAGASPASF